MFVDKIQWINGFKRDLFIEVMNDQSINKSIMMDVGVHRFVLIIVRCRC